MTEGQVRRLETLLDEFNSVLPPLKEFNSPGRDAAPQASRISRARCAGAPSAR